MTLAAVWKTGDRLMAIADTRIIRMSGNVLTEHGPKILPLEIVCRQPGASGFFDREVYRNTVGFAYSGSTLPALSAHALAGVLCSHLIGNEGAPTPSLHDIAMAVAGASAEYMREVCQLSGPAGVFRAIVFGYCPRASALMAYLIDPSFENDSFAAKVSDANVGEAGTAAIIGSCPDLLRERIEADRAAAAERGDTHAIVAQDAPVRALWSIINDGADDSVGGTVQQGWATRAGFEAVATSVPLAPGPTGTRKIGLFALGFDIYDLKNIGDYVVSMVGR